MKSFLKLLPVAIFQLLNHQLMALPVSYQNPPTYVQYVEGEDAFEQNWTPGEARHFWWKDYAKVTGRGILELAASSVPEAGAYTAKYHFEVPQDGTWFIYARTRYPGFVASPFHWQVDDGRVTRQPERDDKIGGNIIDQMMNMKMALVRLGPFEAKKGTHTLTVSVSDFAKDGLSYISQAIDGFSVSPCEVLAFPDSKPVGSEATTLSANVDPQGDGFPDVEIRLSERDWRFYKTLILPVEVNTRSEEGFEGRLRVYQADGSFKDLPFSVLQTEFGTTKEYTFDLLTLMPKEEIATIAHFRVYTHDKWYKAAHAYNVKLGIPRLEGKTDDAPANLFVGPQTGMPAVVEKNSTNGESGAFVWNDSSNTGGFSKANTGNAPDFVFAHHADGKPHETKVEFLPVPDGEAKPGVQRRQFKLTNTSDSVIFRVDFAYQAPITAKDGEFFGGSRRYKLQDMPASESLLGPQRLTHDWACLAADGKTKFTYLEDDAHNDSRLDFSRDDKSGIRWNFSKFTRIKPGETWISPVIVTGEHDGEDWHSSADAFSKWWFSWAVTPKIPDWFRAIGGMTVVGLIYPPNGRTTDLERSGVQKQMPADHLETNRKILSSARDQTGIDWWHSGGWLPLGTEAWYPIGYRLNEEQTKNLRELTDDVRAAGGKTSFYSNPLMFSRVAPDFLEYKDHSQVIDLDGFPVYTEHTHRHHPMALQVADREWGRKFAEIILPVVRDARPDGLYMDQLGAVPVHLDWSENLPESRLGLWCYNQGAFCKEVVEKLRTVNPEIVTGIECFNAYAQQYVTYALLISAEACSVLKFTFPAYTSMVGSYEDLEPEPLVGYAETALLTGQPFICYNDPVKIPESSAKRIKEIITIKRSLDPLLYTLRYRDTVGLRVDQGIDARCFVGDNGKKVVVAVNRTTEWKKVTLEDSSSEIARRWGSEQTGLVGGNTLHLPPESLSAVELIEKR